MNDFTEWLERRDKGKNWLKELGCRSSEIGRHEWIGLMFEQNDIPT